MPPQQIIEIEMKIGFYNNNDNDKEMTTIGAADNNRTATTIAPHYYLYSYKPDKIPLTHWYRRITPEEFRRLVERVEPFPGKGCIMLDEYRKAVALCRITGLDIFACNCMLPRYQLMPKLGELDSALVIEEVRVGCFMGGISPRDPEELKKMVKLGIIQPLR